MTESLTIKKLAAGEVELAKKLILLFGFDDQNVDLPPDEYIAAQLAREDFHVVVALAADELIGGVTAYEMKMFKRETTEMFLYEIEVAAHYRRKGIGAALVERLKNICFEKQIVEMFVGTERENAAARALYAATGGESDEHSVWFNYKFG